LKEKIQSLPAPWNQWLASCKFLISEDKACLLVVPEQLKLIATSLEFLSIAFGIVRSEYPGITAILPVTGTEYDLVDKKLEIHEVRLKE
jgi:hypothetical protein